VKRAEGTHDTADQRGGTSSYLGITEAAVRQLIYRRRLAYTKLGKTVRIDKHAHRSRSWRSDSGRCWRSQANTLRVRAQRPDARRGADDTPAHPTEREIAERLWLDTVKARCLRRGDFLRDGAGRWIDWTLLERPDFVRTEFERRVKTGDYSDTRERGRWPWSCFARELR
jgi:hypothetical protein